MFRVTLILICLTLCPTRWAKSADSVQADSKGNTTNFLASSVVRDSKTKKKMSLGGKIALGTLGALAGQFIGGLVGIAFIVQGDLATFVFLFPVAVVISIAGGVAGAIIAIELGSDTGDDDQAFAPLLQISPTYDVAENGIGMGVSLRF